MYVLMMRDLGSMVDRSKVDDALAGVITLEPFDEDRIAPREPEPDRITPIPNARSMEELRENWGRDPRAIQQQQMLDRTVKTMPRQKPEK